MNIIKKLGGKIRIKNRWARRLLIVGLVAGVFLTPGTPLGPHPAAAGGPEMSEILAPVLVALTFGMLALIRRRFRTSNAH
jgi:hypothetical protein